MSLKVQKGSQIPIINSRITKESQLQMSRISISVLTPKPDVFITQKQIKKLMKLLKMKI